MEGKVIQFRRGRHTYKERHFILDFGINKKIDAEKILGKEVEWTSSSGKKIKGRISACHGNRGLVRAIFEKGLPGQAITTKVKIN